MNLNQLSKETQNETEKLRKRKVSINSDVKKEQTL